MIVLVASTNGNYDKPCPGSTASRDECVYAYAASCVEELEEEHS